MNEQNVPLDSHLSTMPIPSLNMDYVDPCGVWKPLDEKHDELSFDSPAAIKHIFQIHMVVACVVLFTPLILVLRWGHQHPQHWPVEFDRGLIGIASLASVGIFIPAFVIWTWQVVREKYRGSWLRVDRQNGQLILPRQNLLLNTSAVRWSFDHDQFRDKDGTHRRSQLILLIDEKPHRQTIYITARYGAKSLANIHTLCNQFANFTGAAVESPTPPTPVPATVDYESNVEPPVQKYDLDLASAWASLGFAILQFPWQCGLGRSAFDFFHGSFDPVNHQQFVVGRCVLIAPALLALVFGRLAFISHQRGTHRMVAGLGVGIALILLFLFWFASRWHAGD